MRDKSKRIATGRLGFVPAKALRHVATGVVALAGSYLALGARPAHAIHAVCSEVQGAEQAVFVVQDSDCSNPFTPFAGGALQFDSVHFTNAVTSDNVITANGGINSNGNSSFAAGTTATFNGSAVFNGAVTLANTLSTSGINNTGNIGTDTLSTTGLATLNSLSVTNNASVGGTLNVTGQATFHGVTNTGNIATDTLSTTGNATIGGTLGVTGLATFNGIANTGNIGTDTLVATTSIQAPTVNATTVNATTVAATNVNTTNANIGTANVTTALLVSSGATVNMGSNRVQNVAAPVVGTDAANKSYVDASVAGLGGQVDQALAGVNARIDDVSSRTTKATAGVAMAFAMAGVPTVLPNERVAFTMNYGNFQGQNGVAINGAVRLNDNFQLTGGVGYSTNQSLVGARAGLRVGW